MDNPENWQHPVHKNEDRQSKKKTHNTENKKDEHHGPY
jgi:hypothetical protein